MVTKSPSSYRFTAKGLLHYWVAVDAALHQWQKNHSAKERNTINNWKGTSAKNFNKQY